MSSILEKKNQIKHILQFLSQILMSLVFISLLVVEIILILELSNENFLPGVKFDFFGIELAVIPILIIVCLFLTGISILGLIFSLRTIIQIIKKTEMKMYRTQIIALALILGVSFISLQYYYPVWPGDLGIPPKFGPYIGYYGENGMIISWDCDHEQAFTLLWGTDSDAMLNEEKSYVQEWNDNDKIFHHTVIINSLNPGEYYYNLPNEILTNIH